jgi:hypothetical protein
MATCPRCCEKSNGFFKLCACCEQQNNLMTQPKVVVDKTKDED